VDHNNVLVQRKLVDRTSVTHLRCNVFGTYIFARNVLNVRVSSHESVLQSEEAYVVMGGS